LNALNCSTVIFWKRIEKMKDAGVKRGFIYITEMDLDRLRKLISAMSTSDTDKTQEYLETLENGLDQAEIVKLQSIPEDVITMRPKARLLDIDSGKEVVYSLVFPNEADLEKGKISVLAPIGTAMIGYKVGDIIEWEVPAGLRRLRVEEVLYQPEAAGDYHL
jgi:regulator of nucleoside diphosphate kinase